VWLRVSSIDLRRRGESPTAVRVAESDQRRRESSVRSRRVRVVTRGGASHVTHIASNDSTRPRRGHRDSAKLKFLSQSISVSRSGLRPPLCRCVLACKSVCADCDSTHVSPTSAAHPHGAVGTSKPLVQSPLAVFLHPSRLFAAMFAAARSRGARFGIYFAREVGLHWASRPSRMCLPLRDCHRLRRLLCCLGRL
jgi:hypothetical protein